MQQRRKIKIAMVTNHFGVTGISRVMLNYCKALDREKFETTILAGTPISDENKRECEQYHVKLIPLPSRHGEPSRHYYQLWKHLKHEKFDIVHVHGSSSMMAIELTIAKVAGCRNRIAHSHNSKCPNMKIHRLLNPYFRKVYTKALSCGILAGEWLFGKNNFEVLPNGFETQKFIFNSDKRKKVREELHIEDKLVIGHVGRFNGQKNQQFLLKVFEKVALEKENAVLLLVGTGPDLEKIQRLVSTHPYKERIIMSGEIKDTQSMYSAMDIFVLPSLYEGLPVVLLEAQISGLPCVVSDAVTKEADFGNIAWESLKKGEKAWARVICNMTEYSAGERKAYYVNCIENIENFNISKTVKKLEQLYISMV